MKFNFNGFRSKKQQPSRVSANSFQDDRYLIFNSFKDLLKLAYKIVGNTSFWTGGILLATIYAVAFPKLSPKILFETHSPSHPPLIKRNTFWNTD